MKRSLFCLNLITTHDCSVIILFFIYSLLSVSSKKRIILHRRNKSVIEFTLCLTPFPCKAFSLASVLPYTSPLPSLQKPFSWRWNTDVIHLIKRSRLHLQIHQSPPHPEKKKRDSQYFWLPGGASSSVVLPIFFFIGTWKGPHHVMCPLKQIGCPCSNYKVLMGGRMRCNCMDKVHFPGLQKK